MAIDGYLNGATVLFRRHLLYCQAVLFMEQQTLKVLAYLLMNSNSWILIRMVCLIRKGYDRDFGRFGHKPHLQCHPKADAGAPLTTVIAEMMEQGTSKEVAKSVLTTLGFATSIDVTTYDPIESAGNGDTQVMKVLLWLIWKQTEQLSETLDAIYQEITFLYL